ncbi:substrate-binding domain-containing protein [Candidatus Kaistella beijingensis]|uniref:PstS family phosphate ABC transporter substrate-binding protein n=1 Tax=Candidatus Kaistella beijingensis TaxID=2820270 RepID=UPI001CC5B62C|nr:substrate-binding domain-containing protein [Candidatus Kaistella beijingensis]UBB89288.1 substrate-binding domain-containing protein [Candidatus Kaistella beijingensis]
MKHNFQIFLISFFVLVISCKKTDKIVDNPQLGTITVTADESFKSVSEALTERYMALNPNTKINLVIKKEDLAFLDLLDNKARVIIMSRELTEKEKQGYKDKIDMEMQPAKFAADAVVFVVPKNSAKENISVEEIEKELQSDNKKIIFDGTNSSNLNFVAQKFKSTPDKLKYSIISGNKNIIEQLNKYPDKIGVISLNTISRPYDKESESLKNSVKILKVVEGGKSYEPDIINLKNMTYPFTRVLYFLTNEGYYGLGNGFIRFSCQQLGQIVVEKEGLQPYNIFKREVQMR